MMFNRDAILGFGLSLVALAAAGMPARPSHAASTNTMPAATPTPTPESVGATSEVPTAKTSAKTAEQEGSSAASNPAASVRYSLAQCLTQAETNNPLLTAGQHAVSAAQARANAVRGRWYPTLKAQIFTGPAPEARGNPLVTTTPVDEPAQWVKGLRPFGRVELNVVQPIWSFGKIKHAAQAADALVKMENAGATHERWQLRTQVKNLYHAWLLAEQADNLLADVRQKYDQAQAYLDKRLAAENAGVSPTDRLKLKAFGAQIDSKDLDLQIQTVAVHDGLTRLIYGHKPAFSDAEAGTAAAGMPSWRPADSKLRMAKIAAPQLRRLLKHTVEAHPQLNQLDHAIAALESQERFRKAQFYPDLFAVGQLGYAYAPNRDDQESPFARDDFNFFRGGIVLGLRYQWDTGIQSQRLEEARAQLAQRQQQRQALTHKLSHDVQVAHKRFEAQKEAVAVQKNAYKATRGWTAAAMNGFRIGTGPIKEVIEALKNFVAARFAYQEAIYNHNAALAELSQAAGLELQEDLGPVGH